MKNKTFGTTNQAITNDDICNVILRDNKMDRKSLAKNGGNGSAATVWNWINGRTNYPAFAVPAYYWGTQSTALIDYLCRQHDGVFVPLPEVETLAARMEELKDALHLNGAGVVDCLNKATDPASPGGTMIVKSEKRCIRKAVLDVVRAALAVNEIIEEGRGK